MSTALIKYIDKPHPVTGLTNAKLGIWLFLASEVMLFGALFSSYILLRVGSISWPDGSEELLPGPYVMITVSDNGTGMSAEVREHVFEPFFTTKEVGVGTGLGLGIARRIVETHQGHIEVKSRPGKTNMCVRLPVDPSSPDSN